MPSDINFAQELSRLRQEIRSSLSVTESDLWRTEYENILPPRSEPFIRNWRHRQEPSPYIELNYSLIEPMTAARRVAETRHRELSNRYINSEVSVFGKKRSFSKTQDYVEGPENTPDL